MKRKIILFAALIMMFFAQKAFAGELCDKIGIRSTDERVVIDSENDIVYVMQHPTSVVSSIVISPARLKNSVASDDYTLSYVTVEKKSAPLSAKVFYDGYVKAVSKTDKTDIVYIPIEMYKGEVINQSISEISENQGVGISATVGGLDNTALIYTDAAAAKVIEYNVRNSIDNFDTKGTYTCEFAFFAQNGGTLKVSAVESDSTLFTYNTDGSIDAGSDSVINAQRGKWHRGVINYCSATKQFMAYIDGKALPLESDAYDDAYRIFFEAEGNEGSVALADLKVYRGYYYDQYYKLAKISADDENAIADDENIYIDISDISNVEELISHFKTDAKAYFTDTQIGYGANLVLISDSGAFSYYKISLALECSNINFERNDNLLSVSADLNNALSSPQAVTMVAVLKNGEGVICDILFSDACKVDENGAKISISDIECSGLTCEIFFVNTLSDRTPLFDMIYSEQENAK